MAACHFLPVSADPGSGARGRGARYPAAVMDLVPDADERELLLDHLARLIVAAGAETFSAAPYVEPTDRWFPDRWTGDAAAVERVLRRVLRYAGLGDLELTLDIDRFSNPAGKVGEDGHPGGHEGAAAWFAGIHDDVCSFGVDVGQLGDPAGLVGVLAHEVGHAYRHVHDLRDPDRDLEERLTDLTTVYLGFGILTANASQRFRSGISGAGRSFYSRAQSGYLSPQAMCFLLATSVTARGESPRAIARHLSPNQKACFQAACAALGPRDALQARLGLPCASPWAAAPRDRSWLGRLFGR